MFLVEKILVREQEIFKNLDELEIEVIIHYLKQIKLLLIKYQKYL